MLRWADDVLVLLGIVQTSLLSRPDYAQSILDFLLHGADTLPTLVAAMDAPTSDDSALHAYTDFRNAAAQHWPEFLPALSSSSVENLRMDGLRYRPPTATSLARPRTEDALSTLNQLAERLSELAADLRYDAAWERLRPPLALLESCAILDKDGWDTTLAKAQDIVQRALPNPAIRTQETFSGLIACAERLFELAAQTTRPAPPITPSDLDPVLLDVFRIDARDAALQLQPMIAAWTHTIPSAADRMTLRITVQGLRREAAAVGLSAFAADIELLEHLVGVLPLDQLARHLSLIQRCLNDIVGYTEALNEAPQLAWPGGWSDDIIPLIPEFIQPQEAAAALTIEAERLAKFTQLVTTLLREREYLDQRFALLHRHRDHILNEESSRETHEVRAWRAEVERLTQETLGPRHSFSEAARRVETELRELTDLPMTSLIPKIRNAALEASSGTGRKVSLIFDVADHPINRVVLDRVTDWISELVRNAILHGIELPDERAAEGKPSSGRVEVICQRFPSHALIEVRDDGAGLRPEHIAEVARKRGWLGAEKPTPEMLDRLLAMPGFSTLWMDKEAHHRGLSLHTLRRQVESCGGYLGLRWKLGSGFSAVLQMPLERPVIDTVLVRVGSWRLGLPLHLVEVGILLDDCKFDAENSSCEVDGELLPVIPLRHLLGLGPVHSTPKALVVHAAGRKAALEVDAALGREELFLRPFPRPLRAHPVLNALSEGSDGELIWMLNIPEIIRRCTLKSLEVAPIQDERQPATDEEPPSPSTAELPSCKETVLPPEEVAELESPEVTTTDEVGPEPDTPPDEPLIGSPSDTGAEALPTPEFPQVEPIQPSALESSPAPSEISPDLGVSGLETAALPRLLLVSAPTEQRDRLQQILAACGWSVSCADNGQEALNLLSEQPADLVCADLKLAVINGFELISELRARPDYRHLPIIALLDSPHPAAEQRALRLGATRAALKQLPIEQWHSILPSVN
jgi:CheY-like chemotaxis protein